MKTKIKRHSRSVISVLLAVCMLVSCMTVGIIVTDAAKDDSESVGTNVEFYYDFTQLTSGGYNYINESGIWSYGTDRSQIIKGSYPDNDSGKTIAKWEQGGWNTVEVKVSDIPASKNMLIATGDSSYEWGVYGESGGGGGESEAKHAVTISANPSEGGSVSPASGTKIGEETATQIEATPSAGYKFSSWTFGSGITGASTSANPTTITTNSSGDYTVTANFTENTAASPFYYNSYGSNGQPASTHYGAQMTEAEINGVTYSYYHVTGRTESDQLFTVSYGSPKYNDYNTYFQFPKNWGGTPEVQFYATDGKNLGNYTNMTADGEENGKLKWKYPIPDGAREVQFKHGSYYSGKLSFTDGNNAWYVESGMTDLHGWNNSNPVETNFWENFNGTNYTNAFDSKGFGNYYANRGESHAYTKPNDLGAYSGDYYVLVLYKNKTYTINGVTKPISNDPEIIWLPELPDSADTIKVYAKDGAIAGDGQTYADLADTTVLKADGTTSAGAKKYTSTGNQTYEIYKAQKGETITIKTTVGNNDSGELPSASTYRSKYYVRGFMVNGEIPKGTLITTPNTSTGVYTLTYTIPEDYEGNYIEITPVYYLCNTTTYPVVTFRATDFPKNQHNWGDTPYVYPFYGKLGSYNNSFGVYAGQPMVFYNGQYSIQIPKKSTAWAFDSSATYGAASSLEEVNNITISGVTMSNGYYDTVHKKIMGYGDNRSSADHVQTYDYGDFYKIFNEKSPVDNIVFDFKYETTKHNLENDTTGESITKSSLTTAYGTNGNGFELLKNFHGKNVDLFGDALSGTAADPEQTPAVYVVSIGGVNGTRGVENVAGYFATEWRIYAPNDTSSISTTYKRMSAGEKSSIPPEVLILNNDGSTSFNTTTYPSAVEGHTITEWKALYQALETYRGLPVYISYEAADAQQGKCQYFAGTGGATRNDGRWLYSTNGESITSNIKIQYSNDNGTNYIDLDTATPQVSGLSAYFTNPEAYEATTYTTTIDPDKTFDFEAKTTNGSYKFVGWYLDDNNKTLITNDKIGSTERSGSYTFIARFKLVTSGQLNLSHSVDSGTIDGTTYDGAGTVTIGAVVKDKDGNIKKTYPASTADITIDNATYINSDSEYTIDVTLTATRGANSTLGTTVLAVPGGQDSKFFNYGTYTGDTNTRTYTFTIAVKDLYTGTDQDYLNLVYQSYFINYKFNYTVNYEFTDRFGQQKIYNRAGTLNAAQAEAYVFKATDPNTGTERRYLKKEFFESIAPYESNFQKDVRWTFTNSVFTDGTNYVYNCNAHFVATESGAGEKVNVTFVLPYEHTDGVATLTDGVGTAATSKNYDLINDGTTDNRVEFGKIPKLTGNRTNGIYTESDKSHWIAAPAKIYDSSNDKTLFFSHWSVKTTDTDIELARCYYPGFNYLAYNNCEISAEYGASEVDISGSGIYTDVTYLDTTRNQWNALNPLTTSVAPSVEKTNTNVAADVLYNDFVLNYNYNGVNIYKDGSDASDIQELGIVVERVKELDKNSDNTYDTRIQSYTNLAQDTSKVTTAANGANGTTTSGTSKFYKQSINKNALDNKNRILFYEAFYNSAGWDSTNQKPAARYTDKKYVFRAYTYIKYTENGVTHTELSTTPAYFIMYDIATASFSSN